MLKFKVIIKKTTTVRQICPDGVPIVKEVIQNFCCVNYKELCLFCEINEILPHRVRLPEETKEILFYRGQNEEYQQLIE
jgi:hypothetical protein